MGDRKYKPVTSPPPERITLSGEEFAKWVAKRSNVSTAALKSATMLLINGIIDALAEGYDVKLFLLGTFELRRVAPQRRYHRLKKTMYVAPPRQRVHFNKSKTLNQRVVAKANARLEALASKASVPKVTKG